MNDYAIRYRWTDEEFDLLRLFSRALDSKLTDWMEEKRKHKNA